MTNIDIVLTLVFSIVMLMFTAFPSMKIVEWIDTKIPLSEKLYNILLISTTIFLSLCVGVFIRFA